MWRPETVGLATCINTSSNAGLWGSLTNHINMACCCICCQNKSVIMIATIAVMLCSSHGPLAGSCQSKSRLSINPCLQALHALFDGLLQKCTPLPISASRLWFISKEKTPRDRLEPHQKQTLLWSSVWGRSDWFQEKWGTLWSGRRFQTGGRGVVASLHCLSFEVVQEDKQCLG